MNYNDYDIGLSDFLQHERNKEAMTQAEFAEFLGISHITYNTIEVRSRKPGSSVLRKIASKLNVDIREVVRMNERDYE